MRWLALALLALAACPSEHVEAPESRYHFIPTANTALEVWTGPRGNCEEGARAVTVVITDHANMRAQCGHSNDDTAPNLRGCFLPTPAGPPHKPLIVVSAQAPDPVATLGHEWGHWLHWCARVEPGDMGAETDAESVDWPHRTVWFRDTVTGILVASGWRVLAPEVGERSTE